MTDSRSERLLDSAIRSGLIPPEETPRLDLLATEFHDPDGLAREMVRRRWLTAFQADRLLDGRVGELTLGPYLLLDLLGEGGMGRVYKARHRLMNRLVALKVIRPEILALEESRGRFLREIEAAARVWHPNLVTALDASPIGENFVLVMEYVEGATLARLLAERGPPPIRHACDWVRQAALGLHHAHEQGLIHRDVKPSNLLLTDRGNVVKVLDLGLARLDLLGEPEPGDEPLTASGVVIGTPDYMAPEQALAPHDVGPGADVYGLGCTLYHLLAGRPPFPGGTLTQKLLRHQQRDAPDPSRLRPSLPPGLAAVALRMMAKRPEHRPATAAEAADLLAPFCSAARLKTLPASSPDPPADPALTPSPSRHAPVVRHEPADATTYELVPAEGEPPSEASDTSVPAPPGPAEPPTSPLPRPALAEDDSWWRDEPPAPAPAPSAPATSPPPPAPVTPRPRSVPLPLLALAALLATLAALGAYLMAG